MGRLGRVFSSVDAASLDPSPAPEVLFMRVSVGSAVESGTRDGLVGATLPSDSPPVVVSTPGDTPVFEETFELVFPPGVAGPTDSVSPAEPVAPPGPVSDGAPVAPDVTPSEELLDDARGGMATSSCAHAPSRHATTVAVRLAIFRSCIVYFSSAVAHSLETHLRCASQTTWGAKEAYLAGSPAIPGKSRTLYTYSLPRRGAFPTPPPWQASW